MHPADITAALKKLGVSQADIARECGVERQAVSSVINGRGRSKRVEASIASVLGVPLERLWPDRYGAAVSVLGDRNQVAGANITTVRVGESPPSYGDTEARILRLWRALEPDQQSAVEQYMRRLIAG